MTRFEEMHKEEIIDLDRKLEECATIAMRTYLGTPVNTQCIPDSGTGAIGRELWILESYRDPFVRLYQRRHPDTDRTVIIDVIWPILKQDFTDTICQLKVNLREKAELPLMFPIMFYTFVCNNTLNPNTNARRESRTKHREEQAQAMKHENVVAEMKETSKIESYYHCRELCEITRKATGPRSEPKNTYEKSGKKLINYIDETVKKLHEEIGDIDFDEEYIYNLSPFRLAIELSKNAYAVHHYKESAQLGLFLRELLEVSKTENKPLDTLLRMIIVNKMDLLIVRTGVLNKLFGYVFLDFRSPNSLLKWYYESFHPEETSDYWGTSILCLEEFLDKLKCYQMQKTHNVQKHEPKDNCTSQTYEEVEQFSDIYNDLKDGFPLSTDNMKQLYDFYLNKAELGNALVLWDSAKDMFSALYNLLRGKSDGSNLSSNEIRIMLAKVIRGWKYEEIANSVYHCFDPPKPQKNSISQDQSASAL